MSGLPKLFTIVATKVISKSGSGGGKAAGFLNLVKKFFTSPWTWRGVEAATLGFWISDMLGGMSDDSTDQLGGQIPPSVKVALLMNVSQSRSGAASEKYMAE